MIIEELQKIKDCSQKKLALLIRHGERGSIPDNEFGDEVALTDCGMRSSAELGRQLAPYNVRRIYTSPIHRCVQTAQQIQSALGYPVEIVLTHELGAPGFHISDAQSAGKAFLQQSAREVYERFVRGEQVDGLASVESLSTRAIDYIRTKTEQVGLTLFVTHDSLIAHFAFANQLKDYRHEWVNFLDGCIVECGSEEDELKADFTQYWSYLAMSAACRLNLFDDIAAGSNTVNKLVSTAHYNPPVLACLVSALRQAHLLTEQDGVLVLTSKGKLLTEHHPRRLKYACLNWSSEHMDAWQILPYTIQTGEPAFVHLHQKPFFDFLLDNPSRLEEYHKAMDEYARDDYENITKAIHFEKYHTIMDVGGGMGSLLSVIKAAYPEKNCVLFDLPQVVALSNNNDLVKMGGSFFRPLPCEADCILLCRVIHDWDDNRALEILRNVACSLRRGGDLFLIENLREKISDEASLLSLNMKLLTNSQERSQAEYFKLLETGGFRPEILCKLNALQYIIKAQYLKS